jgi:hypothetical protein
MRHAALKVAQIKLSKEECASGMGQKNYVPSKDAQIKLRREECV